MKIAVRYYSRGGHTKKLAEALAAALDVTACPIEKSLEEDVDILFLGSSVYLLGVDKSLVNFIQNITVHVGTIVNFSTSAFKKRTGGIYDMNAVMKNKFSGGTFQQIQEIVKNKGITLSDQQFHCLGQFGQLNKGKPDDSDLKEIQNLARKDVENIK